MWKYTVIGYYPDNEQCARFHVTSMSPENAACDVAAEIDKGVEFTVVDVLPEHVLAYPGAPGDVRYITGEKKGN